MNWYEIQNIETIDSPALVLYKERIEQNIAAAINMIKDVSLLRPHVKTNKIAEVCAMMMAAGITKFKCATIAEAEMLAMIQAKDVLLAYQPVGPKANRLLSLQQHYPQTKFSCVVDNIKTTTHLSKIFSVANETINIFIDLNNGMNRSGILSSKAFELFTQLKNLPGIKLIGLHAYDGHIRNSNLNERQQKSDEGFRAVVELATQIEAVIHQRLIIVAGGSPAFATHIKRQVECSPGTFVFWDWGYKNQFPEAPFDYAALVITRLISIIDDHTICTDLGHKSVAAENPLPRVYFLNAPDVVPIGQSEEHLVLQVQDSCSYKVGDVLYGVPVHICPTVALYENAILVEANKMIATWKVVARNRKINW